MKIRKNALLALFILLFSSLAVSQVFSQEATAEPTAEVTVSPDPDAVVTTTTTTTSSPLEDIGLTINWALALLGLWQIQGIAYALTVEKSIKPMIYSLNLEKTLQSGILIVAVFVGAFAAVQGGGINLFADPPFGLFTNASPIFMTLLNSAFVATGAFMGHEVWTTIESWLKKFKAVTGVIAAPVPGYQSQTGWSPEHK